MKISDAVKRRTEERIKRYAETHFAGRYKRLAIRFRGQFCYVDAYTEPNQEWPGANWTESREEFLERLRNTPYHLFRLRYHGNGQEWGLAFYSYAHGKYEESVFPTGKFLGTPEEAFQAAGEFHL